MLYSIGHSNHTFERFVELLKQYDIELLVDVRSAPRSSYMPHFDKVVLENKLPEQGITYKFLGDMLGGRPDGADYYDSAGYVLYHKLARASSFVNGVDTLTMLSEKHRAAIMCSEENPGTCHRHLLIGRVLHSQGIDLQHIRGNGTLDTYSQLAQREETLHPERMQEDLFGSSREAQWKSIRSVLRENQPKNSSDY